MWVRAPVGAVSADAATGDTTVIESETISVLSYFAAFGAGILSFASPCVLPIVPGYISIITGLDVAELEDGTRQHRWQIIRDTSLFVGGFGTVFVLLGISATAIGSAVFANQLLLTRISGVLVLAMSLFMLGSLIVKAPWMFHEKRFHPRMGRFGRAAPTVAGAAFGFGWTPCIGPVLTSVLAIAATSGRAWAGASLLGVYALGLGIPFLVVGLTMGRMAGTMNWVKNNMTKLVAGSASVLAVFGVLLIFNQLIWVTTTIQEFLRSIGLEWLVNIG
ncbi:MAG: Thiol:disulfide interchange protein DsbD [Acidimicrobiaceae bacterium]|nr:Thiol:disulfide interchange protein DsbD [Acidimicrobiaceae bacterium]